MSKLNCQIHGRQGKVAIGGHKSMCFMCYNDMLRAGDSETFTIVDERYKILKQAADLWAEMNLPPFEVRGWDHGEYKKWTIPELLGEVADRLKEKVE